MCYPGLPKRDEEKKMSRAVCLCRLDSCELTSACYLEISKLLLSTTSLKSLSLARNKVVDKSMRSLCEALSSSQCSLQKLM